jgi:hypothetical protein
MKNRLPVAVFLTAALLSATTALLGGVRESAQCAAAALLALAGWAIFRGRGAARWSLPAGLALLALGAILQTMGYGQPGAVAAFGNAGINRDRTVAAALLLASLAFLLALRSLPGHEPSPRRSHAALLAAAVPVVIALTSAAGEIDRAAQILPLIGGTAVAWVATIAAAAVAGLAVLRADGRYLLPAGALLLAAAAALTFLSLTDGWLYRWNAEHPPGSRNAFVVTGTRYGDAAPSLTQTGMRVDVTAYAVRSGPYPWDAAAALLALLGPALLTAGALRRRTPGPQPPASSA